MNTVVAKERPILFSGPMVKAIIEGRKTQTRRIAKFTTSGHVKEPRGHRRWHREDPDAVLACPYGQPGDRLWVRETWASICREATPYCYCEGDDYHHYIEYRADTGNKYPGDWDDTEDARDKADYLQRWKSPLHMPRKHARLFLEVTDVRVERLQNMTDGDLLAEGCPAIGVDEWCSEAYEWFADLWDSINAKRGYSWESNPWVWVVTFKRITP